MKKELYESLAFSRHADTGSGALPPGGMVHDFNNLLQIILGNAGTLEQELRHHPHCARRISLILKAAERGAGLTRRMLGTACGHDCVPEAVNINEALEGMKDLLGYSLGDDISLKYCFQDDLPMVRIDKIQFETAILNLAVNARDAMPDGGTFALYTGLYYRGADYAAAYYLTIDAVDTGTGIAAEDSEKIFQPYFSTKGGQGTGLGLPMVQAFAEQSGGYIRLFTSPGDGTTFRLFLPVYGQPAAET